MVLCFSSEHSECPEIFKIQFSERIYKDWNLKKHIPVISILIFLLCVGTATATTTIVAEECGLYKLGDAFHLSGTNTESANTYLFVCGPGLPANGVKLTDSSVSAITGTASTFVSVPVYIDKTWDYVWNTSAVLGGPLQPGVYTVYAVSSPKNKADLGSASYNDYEVLLLHATPGTIKKITTDFEKPDSAKISGNYLAWTDIKVDPSSKTLNLYDVDSSQRTTIFNQVQEFDIDGDYVILTANSGNYWVIDFYRISDGSTQVVYNSNNEVRSPAISGKNSVVSVIGRDGPDSEIFLIDIDNPIMVQLTKDSANQTSPSISGDYIVWQDNRNGNWDIFGYDLSKNIEFPVCVAPGDQIKPRISGSTIVWEDIRNWPLIYSYDLESLNTGILLEQFFEQNNPSISGSRVVWEECAESYLVLHDISSGISTSIPKTEGYGLYDRAMPSISNNKIAWVKHDTITSKNYLYLYILSENVAPTAIFTADTYSGTVPLKVQFTDQSTGSPTSWKWSFGDGNSSTEQNPCHTYAMGGNYSVTLEVSNEFSNDSLSKNDYIQVNSPPEDSPRYALVVAPAFEENAEAIITLLKEGFGYKDENLTYISPQEADKDSILEEYNQLADKSENGNNNLFYYHVGHGSRSGRSEVLIIRDIFIFGHSVQTELIDEDDLRNAFNSMKNIRIIFDDCHSGGLTNETDPSRGDDDPGGIEGDDKIVLMATSDWSATMNLPTFTDIDVSGEYVFITDDLYGDILVINITNVQNPDLIKTYNLKINTYDILIHNDKIYVTNGQHGISIFNLVNGKKLEFEENLAIGPNVKKILIDEEHQYYLWDNGIKSENNWELPLNELNCDGKLCYLKQRYTTDFCMNEQYIFAAIYQNDETFLIYIIDKNYGSLTWKPLILDAKSIVLDAIPIDIELYDNLLYVIKNNGELQIFDISDINNIQDKITISIGTISKGDHEYLNRIQADDDYVYVASMDEGVLIIDRDDYTNQLTFNFKGSELEGTSIYGFAINGDYIFALSSNGLNILDKSNPHDIQFVSNYWRPAARLNMFTNYLIQAFTVERDRADKDDDPRISLKEAFYFAHGYLKESAYYISNDLGDGAEPQIFNPNPEKEYYLSDYPINDYWSVKTYCPIDIYVQDGAGNGSGYFKNGATYNSVPQSIYSGYVNGEEFAVFFNPVSPLNIELTAFETGEFDLVLKQFVNGEMNTKYFNDIPVQADSIAYIKMTDAGIDETLELDMDGDDTIDFVYSSTSLPVADFTYNPNFLLIGDSVNFDASYSIDYDGEIVSYEWDFGDGTSQNGKVVSHQFVNSGEYCVGLTVTDGEGNSDNKESFIEIFREDGLLTVHLNSTKYNIEEGSNLTIPVSLSNSHSFDDMINFYFSIENSTSTIYNGPQNTMVVPKQSITELPITLNNLTKENYSINFYGESIHTGETFSSDTIHVTVNTKNIPILATTIHPGWNTFSTPVALDSHTSTLDAIFNSSDSEHIEIILGWDGSAWFIPDTNYILQPIDAVLIKANQNISVTLNPATSITDYPTRNLTAGINLIGSSPEFNSNDFQIMEIEKAFESINSSPNDGIGYTIIVSPSWNQPGWSYVRGNQIKDILPYKGYWIIMENPGTMHGHSKTPLI